MAVNKFLEFDTSKTDIQTDEQYAADSQRTNGIATGIARSEFHNKLYRQFSIMSSAIGDWLVSKGQNASDEDKVALVTALTNAFDTFVQDSADVKVSDEIKDLFLLTDSTNDVEHALLNLGPYPTGSYLGLAGNVNTKMLGASFVPAHLEELKNRNVNLGIQIMKYLMDFQNVSISESEKLEFLKCNDWYDCCNNAIVRSKFSSCGAFMAMVNIIPFAMYAYNYNICEAVVVQKINVLAGTTFFTLNEAIKNQVAMNLIMKNKEICELIRCNTELEKKCFGDNGERLLFLQGSGNFIVPSGVTTLNYVLVSGGGYYTAGRILAGSLTVAPGQSLAYSVGAGINSTTVNDTTLGSLTTTTAGGGTIITDANCSILMRASSGGGESPHCGGCGFGAIGGGNGNTTASRAGSGIGTIASFSDSLININSYRTELNRAANSILVNRLIELGIYGGGGGATFVNPYSYGYGGGGGFGAGSGKNLSSSGPGGPGGAGYGEGAGGGALTAVPSACGSLGNVGAKGVIVLFWGE